MSDPVLALQAAFYTALSAALSCTVYDAGSVEVDAIYPYLVFDVVEAQPADGLNTLNDVVRVYMTVWSKIGDRSQVQEVIQQVYATLHQQRLTLTAGRNVRCQVIRRSTAPDIAGELFSGSITVRALIDR